MRVLVFCSSLGKVRHPMGKLVYNLLSVQDLKRRLKECHLSVQGSREQLIKRHQQFVHIYNSQCDSLNPKSGEATSLRVFYLQCFVLLQAPFSCDLWPPPHFLLSLCILHFNVTWSFQMYAPPHLVRQTEFFLTGIFWKRPRRHWQTPYSQQNLHIHYFDVDICNLSMILIPYFLLSTAEDIARDVEANEKITNQLRGKSKPVYIS